MKKITAAFFENPENLKKLPTIVHLNEKQLDEFLDKLAEAEITKQLVEDAGFDFVDWSKEKK